VNELLKAVLPKTTSAPCTAAFRDSRSSTSPATTSAPLAIRAWLAGLLGSREVPRTFHEGSLRKVSATEVP
jgi:hypothetical protein